MLQAAPLIAPAIKKFWIEMVVGAHAKSALLFWIDVIQSDEGIVEIGRAVLTNLPPAQIEPQVR